MGFPHRRLLRELRQLGQPRGAHSLRICSKPSLVHMSGLNRTGEVAYRSLYPCLPQVVAGGLV